MSEIETDTSDGTNPGSGHSEWSEPSSSGEMGIPSNGALRWLLLTGHRWAVAGLMLGGIFVLHMLLGVTGVISMETVIEQGAIAPVFTALLGVIATVVTIVLSVNQLAMSPQIGPVRRQRARFESAMSLRENIANMVGEDAPPVDPRSFVESSLRGVRDGIESLREEMETADPELRADLAELLDGISDHIDRKYDELSGTEFQDMEMLYALMDEQTSHDLRNLRRLYHRYEEQCSPEQETAFNELIVRLKLFMISRGYFKAGFLQQGLVQFTRAIIYSAVPAFLSAYLGTQLLTVHSFTGTFLGAPNDLWIATLMFVVAASPFAILLSYTARFASISETAIFVSTFET